MNKGVVTKKCENNHIVLTCKTCSKRKVCVTCSDGKIHFYFIRDDLCRPCDRISSIHKNVRLSVLRRRIFNIKPIKLWFEFSSDED
jgi:hypothetical protein